MNIPDLLVFLMWAITDVVILGGVLVVVAIGYEVVADMFRTKAQVAVAKRVATRPLSSRQLAKKRLDSLMKDANEL